jgi:hypothetical protein
MASIGFKLKPWIELDETHLSMCILPCFCDNEKLVLNRATPILPTTAFSGYTSKTGHTDSLSNTTLGAGGAERSGAPSIATSQYHYSCKVWSVLHLAAQSHSACHTLGSNFPRTEIRQKRAKTYAFCAPELSLYRTTLQL